MKKRLVEQFAHYKLFNYRQRKDVVSETIEAFDALRKALEDGERSIVLKRLADVEFMLPVLPGLFSRKIRLVIKNGKMCDYAEGSSILSDILQYNSEEYRYNNGYPPAIDAMIMYVCRSLGNIYEDYKIAPEEVDFFIKEKADAILAPH